MKPFLNWAGGKHKLVKYIDYILPGGGKRLVEPFVGAGSVFLGTNYSDHLLADTNGDLITLFGTLKDHGNTFVQYCNDLCVPGNNNAESYYEYRDIFNTTDDPYLKSALFVYLNRHCFNGLCRYNKSGKFNVSFGRYNKPYFPQLEMENFCAKAQSATFVCADFRDTMLMCRKGDVVYCDPPYVPLSDTANFTSYSSGGFTRQDHIDLAQLAIDLSRDGIPVVISNHDTPFTRRLYRDADTTFELAVPRSISVNGNTRGKAKEILVLFN